jgi:outer membrane protein OmpA-like peptidoglycan-associated protein
MTLAGTLMAAGAVETGNNIVSRSSVDKSDNVRMELTIDLSDVKVSSNHAVVITPLITDGENTVQLGAVGVYGRSRYFRMVRDNEGMLSGLTQERVIRATERPDTVHLPVSVGYEEWMNGANIVLQRTEYARCDCDMQTQMQPMGVFFETSRYKPTLLYRQPVATTEKMANVEGSAYILFPVNDTRLNTVFSNNKLELEKIYSVIDSVKNDPDIVLTGIKLKGFASPEGDYNTNRQLAKGRTEAILSYITNLYQLDKSLISSESEPEDWVATRRFIENTSLKGREEILKIIDTVTDPDAREERIRTEFPSTYHALLTLCYPTLRHTDYRVSYSIRTFSDVQEIERIFMENPRKLSLNELYLLANRYEAGSLAFNKVFSTAVLLYPEDETANLNAANVALSQYDLLAAAHYLNKAGTSGEAEYARGVLWMMRKDYTTARQHLNNAKEAEIHQAQTILDKIQYM